jgi:hypothetical protein
MAFLTSRDTVSELKRLPESQAAHATKDMPRIQRVVMICELRAERKSAAHRMAKDTV